jgi:long-chain fatty acid transport protein
MTRLSPFLLMLLLIPCLPAHASGFGITEQSVSNLGNAFAGGSASAEDASTVFFNPAGMTRLKGTQVTAGLHYIAPSTKFSNEGSTINPLLGGALLTGGNGGDAGVDALAPHFYYVRDINDRWKFGLGIGAPFGLSTSYDDGWVGRYHALDSELKTININPSLAVKLNDRVSLGFGINAMYSEARLTNAVDFSAACLGGAPLATCAFLGLTTPQGTDGEAEVQGDDWGFGFNIGLLWQATDATRIGAHYRSRTEHTLEGDAEFYYPTAGAATFATGAGLVNNADVSADLTTPDSVSLSVYHDINARWAVMADYTWTNWSVFDELRIKFDTGADDSVVTTDWDDTDRFSVGLNYRHNNTWLWRAGAAYDEGATPSAARRTPRVPEEDRTWLALGFNYQPSDNMSVDVGYTHLWVDDARVQKQAVGEDAGRGALVGEWEADVDIISAQMSWRF